MPPKNATDKLLLPGKEVPGDLLRNAIDSMGEGFALFGPDDRLMFCNEAYLDFHPLGADFIQPGVLFEDIIKENIKRGNIADITDNKETYLKNRLEQHRNPKGPIYRRMFDGSSFILNECRTPDGSTLLTTTNVTELRETEEELRESEALARQMLEASPVGVLIATRDGTHLFANERALEIQGITREELFDTNAGSFYADPSERKRIKDKLYKTGNTPPTEVVLVKPDGAKYTVTLTSTLVEFENQKAHLTYLYDITERKKTEAALKESEALLNDALESITDGVVLLDKNDRFVFCNSSYQQFLGKIDHLLVPGTPFEEIVRSAAKNGLFWEGKRDIEGLVEKRMAVHRKRGRVNQRYAETGGWFIVNEYKTSDGGTFIVRTNNTEQRKLEEKVEAEHARLTDAMESIDGGVVLFDKKDRFVLCNSTYRKNLKEISHLFVPGTSYKEILEFYADKGLNTETRDDPKKYVRERMKRHKKLEPATIQMVKTGDWIMLREYQTSDGGTLIVRTDMTDRIKVETALKASEERLTDITEAALDHFWEMGPDLRFSFVSDNFLGQTETSSEVIIGKTPQEFIGPKTVNENPELWKAHQKDLEKHIAFRNFEFSKQFDDGNRRFYNVSGKPFFNKDGNFMGYRGAASDLTDYRRSEQELTHHKKMESLGYLAGGMAHNLNNMLLPILILGQMTKDNLPEESPDHQNLEIICRAAANAQDLVARISGFSRQQGLDRKSADIYKIIRDGLSLIASIVPPRITLKEDLDKNTGTVYLDSTQTQTVLINLIANAVDAMEGKEGALTVTLRKALVEDTGRKFVPGLVSGVYAKLSVTDTGHGMDEETLNKIFDPFFTTKDVQKGTGLGLSTAFGTIHKHGGTIRAFSTVGKGTTFEIYLPLEEILDTADNRRST